MNNTAFIGELYNIILKNIELDNNSKDIMLNILYDISKKYDIQLRHESIGNFDDILELYYNDLFISGLSEKTIKNRRYFFNELNNFISKDLNDITIFDLRSFISHKQQFVVSSTINNMISQIKSFFNWACEEEYISSNPSNKLRKIRNSVQIQKPIDSFDLENMRDNCFSDRDKAIFEFCLSTGLRVSEMSNVNISDLDFTNNRFNVIGKGNKERICLFTDKAKYYILKYLENREDDNDALFVGSKKPYNRLGVRSIEKIIKSIKDKANIDKKITPHSFRRTMATNMINSGAEITTVQKLLGHTNINTTLIYAQTSFDMIEHQYKKSVL